jgi:hypothetical protein
MRYLDHVNPAELQDGAAVAVEVLGGLDTALVFDESMSAQVESVDWFPFPFSV